MNWDHENLNGITLKALTKKGFARFEVKSDNPGPHKRLNPDSLAIPLDRFCNPCDQLAFYSLTFYGWNKDSHFVIDFLLDARGTINFAFPPL